MTEVLRKGNPNTFFMQIPHKFTEPLQILQKRPLSCILKKIWHWKGMTDTDA